MSKRLNQLFATLLSVAIIATSTLSGTTIVKAEGYDETAPVLDSISISGNTTKYRVGDTVYFNLHATEEETGIVEFFFELAATNNAGTALVNVPIINNGYTGGYTASLVITEDMGNGDYYMSSWTAIDSVNNLGGLVCNSDVLFTVVDNSTDNTAPLVNSTRATKETVEPGDTQTIIVECYDKDLKEINIEATDIEKGNYIYRSSLEVTEISEDGLYELSFDITEETCNGTYMVSNVTAYDVYNNKYFGYTDSPAYFEIVNSKDAEEKQISITSYEYSDTTVVIPGVVDIHVEGTATGIKNELRLTLGTIYKGSEYTFYNDTVTVAEDGTWSVDGTLSFPSDSQEGSKSIYFSLINDEINFVNYLDDIILVKSDKEIYKQVALNNPNIVNIINDMDDNGSLLIKSDRGTTNVSKEIFDTIKGTDKELVFDIDGIQWIFNGKDITEETKDININTSVRAVNASEYGYAEDTNAVALVFEANGILPGEAEIKIKSDYIANKFNVGDKLYLGFIKDSADSEEEVVSGNSVSMNEISYEDELIKIEDARVKYDGAYVSLFLNHNSSYILSDKMPVGKTTTEETEKPAAPTVVPSQPTTPQKPAPTVTDKKEDSKPSVSNTEEKKTSKKVTVKSSKVTKLSKKSKNKVKVTVKKASKVTGYQIQISTSKKFKKLNTVTVTSKKTSKTVSIKKIKKNKKTKYYVRVRSYRVVDGKKYYSKWSSKKTIKM